MTTSLNPEFCVKQTRVKDGSVYDFGVRVCDLHKALMIFVECELGFGGRIVSASDTEVVTETHVLGCKDSTSISGTPAAMLEITKIAKAIYTGKLGKLHIQVAGGRIHSVSEWGRGSAITFTYKESVLRIVLEAFSVRNYKPELLRVSYSDLFTALTMFASPHRHIDSIYELLEIK